MRRWLLVSPLCIVLAACGSRTPSTDVAPSTRGSVTSDTLAPLGSRANPVQTGGPFGEREYLQRLRCADGAAPAFKRRGSIGAGGDGHILDDYGVDCPNGGQKASVYMDMYHGDVRERRPVPGFTVLAELPARTAAGCPPQAGPTADSSARYVFNFLEVATPAVPLNHSDGPVDAGFKGYASVGFVIDTTGRVESNSLQFGELVKSREREAAKRYVLGLRYSPAEHHPGCLVRQGTGIQLAFK